MNSNAGGTGQADAALLIDWENLKYSLENRGYRVSISALRDNAESHGRLVVARAYADWKEHGVDAGALYASGIEPVYVPVRRQIEDDGRTRTKNSVDVKLTADCIDLIHRFPNITTYILVSGDQDFIHVINTLRPYGKRTVLIGVSWSTSVRLAEQVDAMVFYDSEVDPPAAIAEQPATERPPQSEPAAGRNGAVKEAAAFLLASSGVEASSDALQLMTRLVETIVNVTDEFRSATPPRPLLLSQLGIELGHRASQAFNRYGRGRLTPIMTALSARGLVQLAERGRVYWVFLPSESVPEDPPSGRDLAQEPRDWRPGYVAESYDELSEPDRSALFGLLQRLQATHPFLSFTRIREELQSSELGVRVDAGRLVNSIKEMGLLQYGEERPWFDSSTGQSGTFHTYLLNRQHPKVVRLEHH